jgi:hypothetical protein
MLDIIILFFLLFWFILFCVIGVFQVYYNFSNDKIGFLPSISSKLNKQLAIIFEKHIKDTSKYEFIERGAGLANISGYIQKNFNFKKVTAVEIDFITIFFGKLLAKLTRSKIEFVRQNVFDYKVPKKSVLYFYLTTSILEKLYQQGKLDGHVVISTTFKLKNLKPDESIKMNNFYRWMYVYDFRDKKK